ncbi:MAG: phosphatidylserine decarboxylase [Legionellales bacterium]|nr:phosphatidylserine decarboxylase [Legionellales bacterium]
MLNYLKILILHCLPQHKLSKLIHRLSRIEFKPFKNMLINTFIRIYNVDMRIAEYQNSNDYDSFNSFFTRKLKKNTRKWEINNHLVLSPVDGQISQIGNINNHRLIQAKRKKYNLEQLLGNDKNLAHEFKNGSFATLYLSPRDYHRIHMPVTGRLIKSIYIPGDLFPVNNSSVNNIDKLFSRNERFVSIFITDIGLMAQIMVGAIFVGSMETVWSGEIIPSKKGEKIINDYKENNIKLVQGDEFGHFNMGSTVILLFQKNKIAWLSDKIKNVSINSGQSLGNIKIK